MESGAGEVSFRQKVQMLDKNRDIILFCIPEAGVIPHFAALCIVARTMQELGYAVAFTRCTRTFTRCPVMDMHSLPYVGGMDIKAQICANCESVSSQVLQLYGLRSIDLGRLVTESVRNRVQAAIEKAPVDLREFTFDGIPFGKVVGHDLVLATKVHDLSDPNTVDRAAWISYIESALLMFLGIGDLCDHLPVKRMIYYNDYFLNLTCRLVGSRRGIPALTFSQASHLNVDRRRYVMQSEIASRAHHQEILRWSEWRNLSLAVHDVRAVGDDILHRFRGQGSHLYSPAKQVQQSKFFESFDLSPQRKLLVAYTSSLDEKIAGELTDEGLGIKTAASEQPFADQIEWLKALTDYVRRSDHLQLIVRIHPREGANKRERIPSQHLEQLRRDFNRRVDHCRFVWPEDVVSSYDLLEIADVVLTSWTTVGLEAARLGVPSMMAFGQVSYPHDDFLVWAPTAKEYFAHLEYLLSNDGSLDRVARAFRSSYVYRLGCSLDLGDVVPSSDFTAFPPFKMPREAFAIEEAIVSVKGIWDINRERSKVAQSAESVAAETDELKKQLRRIIHFLQTGEDRPITTLEMVPAEFDSNDRGPATTSSGNAEVARISVVANKTQYHFGGQTFRRTSPMVARLVPLCARGLTTGTKVRTGLSRESNRTRILFVNTYYPKFVENHYRKNAGLQSASYDRQIESLVAARFGDSDFYSGPLIERGWWAQDLIVNCRPLQRAWASENSFAGAELEIALEQVRQVRPHVVYLQDLSLATSDFLSAIRPNTELIVGQIACPLPPHADLSQIDIIFTSFPHFVERFRAAGVTAYYSPLAFDPRILTNLPRAERKFPVTFIGGLSAAHTQGSQFLEAVTKAVPLDVWGYGCEILAPNSPIRTRHHGEIWGLEMFSLFQQSRITLNRHIDVAENYANNMRLFEGTGCGALLITDYRDNLNELFDIGKEVVAYRDAEECVALVKYYLAHPQEAEAIARAGQQRTLREHTYANRMERTAEILERHLRYVREKNRFLPVDPGKISYGHQGISAAEVREDLTSAWKSPQIPDKQRGLVQQELGLMYKGKPPLVYQVLAEALRPVIKNGNSILEIGCSSGYYYEVLAYLLRKRIAYTGVDYSKAMIALAKDYYPPINFHVADGARLPFKAEEFDIAISSCILLHVPNYPEHITEAARVAKRFIVVHRTPICRRRPTQYLTKFAYDVKTVELRFNEREMVSLFLQNGLQLINALEYQTSAERDEFEATYVFQKNSGRAH